MQKLPTGTLLSAYVDKTRNNFFNSQGLRRAVIRSVTGTNRTGVFRSAIQVVFEKVTISGGPNAVLHWECNISNSSKRRSYPLNSNALCQYDIAIPVNLPIIYLDLYEDSTTLYLSGSQSFTSL